MSDRAYGRGGVSVVVPVYNSQCILPDLVRRIEAVLADVHEPFEVLLVNDGSGDGSWHAVRQLATVHRAVRGICLMRNYGQHNALLAGIRAARHPIIVTLDDDLQHPPEEIPQLLQTLDEGWDVVYGTPVQEQHGFWRDVASQVTKLALQGTMGAETARKAGPFRAFRTRLRDAFSSYQGPFVSIDVLLTWATSSFTSVPTRYDRRLSGASNYTLPKLVTHALNMMTGFSTLPLRVASLVGFAFTALGIVLLGYVFFRYVNEGGSVPGFPFLASVIVTFSGAQLFALGVMGEYLARMHFRMMDKPPYAIRESTEPWGP